MSLMSIRNIEDVLKNMDNLLNSAKNLKQLEAMLRKIFDICRTKNMKIKTQQV